MAGDTILVERGPVTTVTLNRPERHNAISTEMGDALVNALTAAGRDPSVKVIVLAGAGRSFCSGDDRGEGAGGRIPDFPWENPYHSPHVEPFGVYRHGYFQLMALIRRLPQAVIARVHGHCIGSGVDLMLAADYAVADETAAIRLVFGERGIGPAGTVFLPKYVGLKRAMDLLFAPDALTARQACDLGLVTSVAAPGELDAEVARLAERLLAVATTHYGYIGMVKEAINRSIFPALDEDVRTQVLTTRLADMYKATHPDRRVLSAEC
jgi:enoyl-CoA hydratase/carnithine racemase